MDWWTQQRKERLGPDYGRASTDAILYHLEKRRPVGLLGDPERGSTDSVHYHLEKAASGGLLRDPGRAALTLYSLPSHGEERPVGLLGVPGSKENTLPIPEVNRMIMPDISETTQTRREKQARNRIVRK